MARWFSSDLHFSHANIIRFCHRPFWTIEGGEQVPDVPRMDDELVARINECVGPDDELWLLGDIAMGNLSESLPIVSRLVAGRKVLVAGNHDRVHPYNGKRAERFTEQYDAVFDEVIPGNTELVLADGVTVQMSHFPYSLSPTEARARCGETSTTDKFAAWRPVDDGRWLLCGHVHDAWRQSGRTINVGIDAWGGWPASEDEVVRLIAEGPTQRAPLPW